MIKLRIFVLAFLSLCEADDHVRYAAVIYRHGDRTPVDPYPTDPYKNESLWPVKFGELTNIGKRQHYALGQWMRERYSHLLSSNFERSEIYVRSTDVDRTLMSAQVNLAGMYPPSGKSIWDDSLLWQPIPVHTVPEKEDNLLAMKKPCPEYNMAMGDYLRSTSYKKRLSKYQDLLNYLSAYSGRKIVDYNGINYIYDILYIESLYNFTLPNWTKSVFPNEMKEPTGYSFTTETATPELARLKAGPLLKYIVNQMSNTIDYDNSIRNQPEVNLAIFSGHDTTVANVLNGLGLFDYVAPAYTSTVFLELLYANDLHSTPLIRISYRDSTDIMEPNVLNIPLCGQLCPLERFIHLYENLLTVDWDYECDKQFPAPLSMTFFFGLGVFTMMFIGYQLHFYKIYHRYRSDAPPLYTRVDTGAPPLYTRVDTSATTQILTSPLK